MEIMAILDFAKFVWERDVEAHHGRGMRYCTFGFRPDEDFIVFERSNLVLELQVGSPC